MGVTWRGAEVCAAVVEYAGGTWNELMRAERDGDENFSVSVCSTPSSSAEFSTTTVSLDRTSSSVIGRLPNIISAWSLLCASSSNE